MSGFRWPAPDGCEHVTWAGRHFEADGAPCDVLAFGVEASGWSDELTTLHEGATGADHPIDLASRARAIGEVTSHSKSAGGVVLEVGCSSGYLLRELKATLPASTTLIGADYVLGPLRALARSDLGLPLLRFDLTRCPLDSDSVDAVVALNVLEHIEDDQRAAREISRILKPGGVAIIELPAGPGLFDVYDKALMHHRRYTLSSACALFERAGLRITRRSHLGFFVFPAFAAVKLSNKRHLRKSLAEQHAIVASSIASSGSSRLMRAAMRAERVLSSRVSFPIGIRCVLTAVKP